MSPKQERQDGDIPLVRVESDPTPRISSTFEVGGRGQDDTPTPSPDRLNTPPLTTSRLGQIQPRGHSQEPHVRGRTPTRPTSRPPSRPTSWGFAPPMAVQATSSSATAAEHIEGLHENTNSNADGVPQIPRLQTHRSGNLDGHQYIFGASGSGRASRGHESAPASPSMGSFQNVRDAIHRVTHTRNFGQYHAREQRTRSQSPRAASPLRLLWPLSRNGSREEPFIPQDPYRFRRGPFFFARPTNIVATNATTEPHPTGPCCFPQEFLITLYKRSSEPLVQLYLHFLLRLPSTYFSRVSRIFEDAAVTKPEIDKLIQRVSEGAELPREWTTQLVSPALIRFKARWEEFVDGAIKEWKTLNLVSALLSSAIVSMFQVESVVNQPVTRTAALISLVCALWSLIYGGTYILRFGTMRGMEKASMWAEEAKKTQTAIFWNVWILLALPAVWLAWSMIAFFVSILSFVWTTGSRTDEQHLPSDNVANALRIVITTLVGIGLVYFALIVRTFSNYGKRCKNRKGNGTRTGTGAMGLGSNREAEVRSLQGVMNSFVGNGGEIGGVGNVGGVGSQDASAKGYSVSENGDLEKGNLVLEDQRMVRDHDARSNGSRLASPKL